MFRALGIGVIVVAGAHTLSAQPARVSAPISEISYEITADSAAVGRSQLGVTMSFRVSGTAPVILALPAWSPGHYVLLWFARRVSHFSAESGAVPLDWKKLDFQTWEIHPRSAGVVRVSFSYLANAVDRAVAWTSPNFAFFNGTNLFLYPVGRGFDWPARVTVRTEPSWRIATGMDPAGTNAFTAGNYHDLTDMPFYVGRFAIDSTQIAGKWIRLAWYPAASLTPSRRDRTFGWLQKFVPAEIAVFGEAPFRNYKLFQRSDTVVTTVFDGGWPNAPHRVIRNDTVDAWEAAGMPDQGRRPGDGEEIASRNGRPVLRYDDAQPTRDTDGDVRSMAMYAGTSVRAVKEPESARRIVERAASML